MNTIDEPEPDPAKEEINNPEEDEPYACSNQRKTVCALPDGGHLLSAVWLRRGVQDALRLDGFLLDYNCRFLPCIGGLLWLVFLLVQVTF